MTEAFRNRAAQTLRVDAVRAPKIAFLWRGRPTRARLVWHTAGFALAVGWELAQAIHVVRGTFDPLDLAASAGGYLLGAVRSS